MAWNDGQFQWTRDEAYADQLQGRYGHEHDERLADLVNLENGVRKYWADKLRAFAERYDAGTDERAETEHAAALLDPYDETGKDDGFHATTVDTGNEDGAVGTLWVFPA